MSEAISMNRREHWESVYRTKPDEGLSWYQAAPSASLEVINSLQPFPARLIDIGGGQSALAGALVDHADAQVTVLDISAAALDRARARLGEKAARVRWIAADILDEPALEPVDLWHDRAVFHFLTEPRDQRTYAALAARTVVPGGHVLIATFAPAGPERCSGLPVSRYDAPALAAVFAPWFTLRDSRAITHITPWGKEQAFTLALLERTGETYLQSDGRG